MYKIYMKSILIVALLLLIGCEDHKKLAITTGPEALVNADKYKDQLIGWWRFDEKSGDTAADVSGNGNTANILNGGWGAGKHGGALQMNGGNDSIVTIPLTDSLLSTVREITLMAWTYRTAVHNVDVVGHTYPYLFFGFHGPRFKFQLGNQKGKLAKCYADKKYKAETGVWYHLAGTYDGKRIHLYVDGKEICSAPLTGLIAMPKAPFTISGYRNKKDKIIDEITGKIDDVKIYNRALSDEEIINAMNATD